MHAAESGKLPAAAHYRGGYRFYLGFVAAVEYKIHCLYQFRIRHKAPMKITL
jgi:hypothetical protein